MTSLQPLRTIIRTHLPALRSSPCLLVTSSPPLDTKSPNKTTNDFVQSNTQLIAHNIRSIPVTIDAAFPTSRKVHEALTLVQRAGVKDGLVLGIGSGPAMDLAKALSAKLHTGSDDENKLILAPATLGGMYAASSPQTLLLDTGEEMLLPQWSKGKASIAYDAKYFSCAPLYTFDKGLSMAHVAAALLTILLDVARTIHVANEQMKSVAKSCVTVLKAAATKDESFSHEAQQHLMEAILQLSILQSTAQETIPQTLTNALLPTYFPQNHVFTYLGCMLPGLCETLESNGIVEEISKSILDETANADLTSWAVSISKEAGIPSMASLAFGTPDLKTLLDKVDAYSTLRRGNEGVYLISEVLERSLNR
ncbi:hypothetical protein ACHAWO_000160 [Cyclotella atomus]|uniref:Alcohol dehydrogenase iron-type/glycerol dehydrogenase GldA domain-containing protein n=1 Tax=Cyclotella atomus TaxID=382360 RepID=A0ABD3NUG7_9STRA